MGYAVEPPRDKRLEATGVSNIFLLDILPDVPDGDFVKVYLYALMCCQQGEYLTHSELAARLSLPVEKVLAAWRYFESRAVVRKAAKTPGDETHFDVTFADLRGLMYAKAQGPSQAAKAAAGALRDGTLATLAEQVAALTGDPAFGAGDVQQIRKWLEDWGATPEAVLGAYRYGIETRGVARTSYVGKIVREWTDKGIRTEADVAGPPPEVDARHAFYKELMEALGIGYKSVTDAEKRVFDRWTDEYGYAPAELVEKAKEKTAGTGNALKYLDAILKKERAKAAGGEGGGAGAGSGRGGLGGAGLGERAAYYKRVRERNAAEADARLAEAYEMAPGLKALDEELVALNMESVKLVTSSMADKKGAWERLEAEVAEKKAARVKMLEAAGLPADYTALHYDCKRCEDTGFVIGTGASCDCYLRGGMR